MTFNHGTLHCTVIWGSACGSEHTIGGWRHVQHHSRSVCVVLVLTVMSGTRIWWDVKPSAPLYTLLHLEPSCCSHITQEQLIVNVLLTTWVYLLQGTDFHIYVCGCKCAFESKEWLFVNDVLKILDWMGPVRQGVLDCRWGGRRQVDGSRPITKPVWIRCHVWKHWPAQKNHTKRRCGRWEGPQVPLFEQNKHLLPNHHPYH